MATPQSGSFRTWANRIIRATERSATQLDKMENDIKEIREELSEIREMLREWYTDWKESG
jgi:predicted transcriptional regulator